MEDHVGCASILAQLRQETRVLHLSLETHAGILAGLASVDQYRETLGKFFGIYSVLEPQIAALEGLSIWLDDYDERQQLPSLLSDLLFLGSDPFVLPICHDIPTITSVSEALGCLYVLEGSTLGGQFIARQVHSKLGFTPELGCRFFSSADRNVHEKWTSFTKSVDLFAKCDLAQRPAIIAAAVRTFEAFLAWFTKNKGIAFNVA